MNVQAQELRLGIRRLLFQVAVTVETALVFVQPVLVGSLLSGHYEMLAAHRYGAFATIAVAAIMTVLAFAARGADAPRWLPAVSALIVLIEAGQISWGYQRVLYVHIPLGVALAAAMMLLLVWAWRPARPNRVTDPSPRRNGAGLIGTTVRGTDPVPDR
jgi:hypothetical protein